jgi:small-conductance mechanosensitive channel
MSLPDDFTKLREKVDKADQSIRAAAAKDEAELKAMVDDARKKADERAAVLRAKSDEVSDSAERQWQEVQSDWDEHIKRIRERMDAKKDELDAKVAEHDAEWAEADAIDAVNFASAAIEEAQYAVLDAVLARRRADVMAAAV